MVYIPSHHRRSKKGEKKPDWNNWPQIEKKIWYLERMSHVMGKNEMKLYQKNKKIPSWREVNLKKKI